MLVTAYLPVFLLNEKEYPTVDAALMDRGYSAEDVADALKYAEIHQTPYVFFGLGDIPDVSHPMGILINDGGKWRAWFSSREWGSETEANAEDIGRRSDRLDWRVIRFDMASSLFGDRSQ